MSKHPWIFIAALSSVAVLGCSKPTSTMHPLSADFFVTEVRNADVLATRAPAKLHESRAECEANLTKAICETDATTKQISENYGDIKCAPNGAQYVPALMAIYDEMPELMRPSLCSLDRVFLSDGIASVAFASAVTDALQRRIGGYVGMRLATFLKQPASRELFTWKEQLAYGGSKKFLSNDPSLVQINSSFKMSKLPTDGLFYVLMHELGHLIDFGNEINSDVRQTSWSRLSWTANGTPLASATYFDRDQFCFYDCVNYVSPHDAKAIYTSLQKSAFVTTYASSNAWEDFAEFWAWRLLLESKAPQYEVVIPGETTLDIVKAFETNPKIKLKLDYVTTLWNTSTLKIDNRVSTSP